MRMLRDLVFDMKPQEALAYLEYAPTKSARVYYKALHSAIANASNLLKVQADVLKFKLLTIEEGRRLKRYKAGSKGMAKPITREYCHVKIILIEDPTLKSAKKVKKTDKNENTPSEAKPARKKESTTKEVKKVKEKEATPKKSESIKEKKAVKKEVK